MIDTLVVDLGGVAARFRPERRLAALASLSELPPDVVQARLFDSGLEDRAELGELSRDEVIEAVQTALGGRVPLQAIIEAWASAFEINESVIECIAALDVRRALFTNNGPMLDACIEGPLHRLAEAFDEVICSWHIKARKPATAAFDAAAAHLQCAPGNLLLLDDSESNVKAALAKGWQAVRVRNAAEVRKAVLRLRT